ncbi:hypothetical protein ACIQWA_05585 [Kitasatospora sp. NPDC098652]|uniref:hypothetical protein n=1 Tax=Kitasatospora sp. NPDC098652 TaxID=3364095 RepID=UPI00382C9C85
MRWIAGGTGAGKSTLARVLADRHDLAVYDGDRAEHGWLARCTPQRHPRLSALREAPPGDMWRGRTPREVFQAMPGLHGETAGFLVDDLLAMPRDRVILVDYFGILPVHLGPLLGRPDRAVFLLPTPRFRRNALAARYADPARARANWGSSDLETTLAKRLGRDALWDEEVRRQADRYGLDTITIDGGVPVTDLAGQVATRFGLLSGA